MGKRITTSDIEGLQPKQRIFDTELRGLTARRLSTGVAHWSLRYWTAGRTRELALGRCSELTPTQARRLATKVRAELAAGVDPLEAKKHEREKAAGRKTLKQFSVEYSKAIEKKPLTKESDESILEKWVLPMLGDVYVADIGREQAQRLHAHVTGKGFPIRANRCHALLSHMLTEAARRGLREAPLPRGTVVMNAEKPRDRYLSATEVSRLWKVLVDLQKPRKSGLPGSHTDAAQAVQLLLLTGARKREILGLRWTDVDQEASCLRLSDTKTGARRIELSPAALEILKKRKPADDDENASDFVFPRDDGEAPLADVKRCWAAAIDEDAANLPGVRIHDLRHTLASQAIAAGLTLREVGALLGHRSQQTTQRYAHLSDEIAQAAANRVGARLAQIVDAADGLRAVK